MRKIALFILFPFVFYVAAAQNFYNVDSLAEKLYEHKDVVDFKIELDRIFANKKDKATLIEYLIKQVSESSKKEVKFLKAMLLKHYRCVLSEKLDAEKCLRCFKEVENIFYSIGEHCQAVSSLNVLANQLSQNAKDTLLAYQMLLEAMRKAEKMKCYDVLVRTQYLIGSYLGERYGNYKKSLENTFLAYELSEKYEVSRATKIEVLQYLGSLFYKASNYDKARAVWQEMYDVSNLLSTQEKKRIYFSDARTLNNIGLTYKNIENYDSALLYYQRAIRAAQIDRDTFWQNLPKGNIGDILLKKNQLDSAYFLYQDYLKNAYRYEDWSIVVAGHSKLANYYILKKDLEKAQKEVEIAEYILKEKRKEIFSLNPILIGVSQKNIYGYKSELEKLKGNFKEALEWQEQYTTLNDSLNKMINARQLELLAIDYQIKQENVKKIALQEEVKKRGWFVLLSTFVSFISISLGILLLYNRYKIQKQKALLQKQNQEIEAINQMLQVKNQDITDSILYAKRIQQAFLPYENRIQALLKDYFILYKPRDIVSGDFYYVIEQNGLIFMIVGDCTGHGVPGALMSMLAVTLLDQIIIEKAIQKPAEIIKALDKGVIKALHQEQSSSQDGMDISVCVWNRENRGLQIAGAKSSVVLLNYDKLEEIIANRYTVGGIGNTQADKNFDEYERILAPNTMLYLFTDGYLDQFSEKGKKIGKKRFLNLLLQYHQKPSLHQKHQLQTFLQEWQGQEEQIDDVTILGVRFP
ncbi:MAG: hypothetical protein Fur0027_00480 [Raineya sp.]